MIIPIISIIKKYSFDLNLKNLNSILKKIHENNIKMHDILIYFKVNEKSWS